MARILKVILTFALMATSIAFMYQACMWLILGFNQMAIFMFLAAGASVILSLIIWSNFNKQWPADIERVGDDDIDHYTNVGPKAYPDPNNKWWEFWR